MLLKEATEKLNAMEEKLHAYRHAMGALYLDGNTVGPKQSYKGRGRTIEVLSPVVYNLIVNDETKEITDTILYSADAPKDIRRRAEIIREEYDDNTRIPMEEYVAFESLTNEASVVWHDAKENSDFPMFAPYLEKLIDYRKKFASYKDSTRTPYDVMLDEYEKGVTVGTLDNFFGLLQEKLTPVIAAVNNSAKPRTDFLFRTYPVEKQRLFSADVMRLMGIDTSRCSLGETEHPFTDGFNKWDVRITTHYHENDVASSMYSVIHEGGHALYELGTADEIQFTVLGTGSSMGIHESQSRFYENLIGRSRPFIHALYPLMRKNFPEQMSDVTEEELYLAVNAAQPSLIRTEADELTYPMHVMIRYELEKQMINGTVNVMDLPQMWNAAYKKYLGVSVPNDREGILQDSHWSGGSFGYFPSYALGSAYGVQMLGAMEKEIDVWGNVSCGNMKPVTDWLGEKIHKYGCLLKPAELLRNAIGGEFDPQCYVQYLTSKFTELYHL